VIVLLGTILRGWGLDSDLPFVRHPDEPVSVNLAQAMFRNHDQNPHFFGYPSLHFYLNEALYVPYYAVGRIAGRFATRADAVPPLETLGMGITRAPSPAVFTLGRSLMVAFGVATIVALYVAGRSLFGSATVGLLAALAFAVLPTSVELNRSITPDTPATFWVTATLLASIAVLRTGRVAAYVVGGILVGLAASTKYNACFAAVMLVAAHVLRAGWRDILAPRLVAAGLASVLAFVVTMPYAILDHDAFVAALRFEGRHYGGGHPGMEGDALRWYVGYMGSTALAIYTLAAMLCVSGFVRRQTHVMLVASFPVVYFAFISAFEVRNDRTLLLLAPHACLLAAVALVQASRFVATRMPAAVGWRVMLAAASCAVLAQPVGASVAFVMRSSGPDSRDEAREWIVRTLPPGTRIALESYAPFVDPARFDVAVVFALIDHEPGWFVEQGFRYAVASRGMYGRYYDDARRYPGQRARYDALFARFPTVARFDDGRNEVRMLAVR
jgi:4-amino-4-deoxy-L-arabinose transferase-like glycosyltransferase